MLELVFKKWKLINRERTNGKEGCMILGNLLTPILIAHNNT